MRQVDCQIFLLILSYYLLENISEIHHFCAFMITDIFHRRGKSCSGSSIRTR